MFLGTSMDYGLRLEIIQSAKKCAFINFIHTILPLREYNLSLKTVLTLIGI